MQIKRPKITLEGIQIKSLKKAQDLSEALSIIEEECGIHECLITISDIFLCPEIDLSHLNRTSMENLLRGILEDIRKQTYK